MKMFLINRIKKLCEWNTIINFNRFLLWWVFLVLVEGISNSCRYFIPDVKGIWYFFLLTITAMMIASLLSSGVYFIISEAFLKRFFCEKFTWRKKTDFNLICFMLFENKTWNHRFVATEFNIRSSSCRINSSLF